MPDTLVLLYYCHQTTLIHRLIIDECHERSIEADLLDGLDGG